MAERAAPTERLCRNCYALVTGPYCAQCGQKVRLHRSLRAFMSDLFQGIYNFEGRIWTTLPMLAWRPGDLTRRYIAGERARYVSPVALYLFSVFVMFAVLNFDSPARGSGGVTANISIAVDDERAALERLLAERRRLEARGTSLSAIDRRIAAARSDLDQLERVQRGDFTGAEAMDEGPQWLRTAVGRVQKDPEAFIRNVQDAASKYSWALIPLSVPFLWLLFPFDRRYRMYDHTIFVTYSLAFMMILTVISGLLVRVGADGLASLLFFVPPIHMYRQLRGAYGLSRPAALFRTALLLVFAIAVGALFFVAMLGLGLIG